MTLLLLEQFGGTTLAMGRIPASALQRSLVEERLGKRVEKEADGRQTTSDEAQRFCSLTRVLRASLQAVIDEAFDELRRLLP